MADTRLILHIKGTEGQTTELPKQIVRAGIAEGQITRSQLIWSTAHNAWKQVRELPHLLPSQKLAPPPTPRVATVALPKVVGSGQTGPVPRIAGKPGVAAEGIPVAQNSQVARATAPMKAPSTAHLMVKDDDDGVHPMKWLCFILGGLILAIVAANYFLVDQPLVASMSQTRYAKLTIYGHLGAFIQPKALVIHLPTAAVSSDSDLVDLLGDLAHSTPPAPMSNATFDYVSLTTSWRGHFTISGFAWKEFGDMGRDDLTQREAFLLDQLRDASGQTLVTPSGALDPSAEQDERDKVWAQFTAYFTAKP